MELKNKDRKNERKDIMNIVERKREMGMSQVKSMDLDEIHIASWEQK